MLYEVITFVSDVQSVKEHRRRHKRGITEHLPVTVELLKDTGIKDGGKHIAIADRVFELLLQICLFCFKIDRLKQLTGIV